MARPDSVLLVDDEDLFAETTRDLLVDAGYECDRAADADSAIAFVGQRSYDLVISDLLMPGNVDLELVRRLASAYKGLPVIVVTGYPSLSTAIEALGLPVTAYFVKPFEFHELLKQVRLGIERHHLFSWAEDVSAHAAAFARDIAKAPEWMTSAPGLSQPETAVNFAAAAAQHAVRSMFDVVRMLSVLRGHSETFDAVPCEATHCARLQRHRAAIQDAIGTLAHTKSSFKSPELASLRRDLERVLEEGS